MKKRNYKFIAILMMLFVGFGFFSTTNAAKNPEKVDKSTKQQKQNKPVKSNNGSIKGTITSIKGNTITVEIRENKIKSSKTIITDAKTRFGVKQIKVKGTDGKKDQTKPVKATIADFKVGNKVTINGKTNTNGTVTAKNIKHVPVKNKKK